MSSLPAAAWAAAPTAGAQTRTDARRRARASSLRLEKAEKAEMAQILKCAASNQADPAAQDSLDDTMATLASAAR